MLVVCVAQHQSWLIALAKAQMLEDERIPRVVSEEFAVCRHDRKENFLSKGTVEPVRENMNFMELGVEMCTRTVQLNTVTLTRSKTRMAHFFRTYRYPRLSTDERSQLFHSSKGVKDASSEALIVGDSILSHVNGEVETWIRGLKRQRF